MPLQEPVKWDSPMGPHKKNQFWFGDRIVRDTRICGGQPVIKGTRVILRTLIASLPEGDSVEEILATFPSLTSEDMRAVFAFAAASAMEDLPNPAIPQIR